MDFSEHELATIERLRSYQRHWRWLRWFMLVAAVVSTVAFALLSYRMWELISQVNEQGPSALDAWRLAWLYTPLAVFTAVSTVCWVIALSHWRTGNPLFALLLRLAGNARAKNGSA